MPGCPRSDFRTWETTTSTGNLHEASMAAPLRGTQSLVGQMGWVSSGLRSPRLKWFGAGLFGLPFLVVCWIQTRNILDELRPGSAGLSNFDPQNPWVAAAQLSNAWALYQSSRSGGVVLAAAACRARLGGRFRPEPQLHLKRMDSTLPFHPVAMIALQSRLAGFFCPHCWGWLRSMQWSPRRTSPPMPSRT